MTGKAVYARSYMKAPYQFMIPLVILAAMGRVTSPVQADHAEWEVDVFSSGVTFSPNGARYEFTCDPGGVNPAPPLTITTCAPASFPDPGGDGWWWACGVWLDSGPGCGRATSTEDAYIRVRGTGTHSLTVELRGLAYDDYDCCCAGCAADGWYCPVTIPVARAFSFTSPSLDPLVVEVNVPGMPDGAEVDVSCQYAYSKRARPEGPTGASGGGGGNLAAAAGTMTVIDPLTGLVVPLVEESTDIWDASGNAQGGGTFSFTATTGSAILIMLSAYVDAWVWEPPNGMDCVPPWQAKPEVDGASAGVDLSLTCTVDGGGGGSPQACCFTDGSCAGLAPEVCTDLSGTPQGPGTTCATVVCPMPPPPDQACCFPGTDDCGDLPPDFCSSIGGMPQGPDTECATTVCFAQACCYPGGTCEDLAPPDCAPSGGTSMGPGTTCGSFVCPGPPPQKCCLPEGCDNLPPAACTSIGGLPMGPGTVCPSAAFCPLPQACCLPDGSCDNLYPGYCESLGGTTPGPGITCASPGACPPGPPQACCFPDAPCIDFPPTDCFSFGGTAMGPGSSCASSPCPVPPPSREACCLSDGECIATLVDGCSELGGTAMGPGTSCDSSICSSSGPCAPVADPTGTNKTRFVSFSVSACPVASGAATALRVRLVSLHHVDPPYSGGPSIPFTSFEGQSRWVGPPTQYVESSSSGIPFYASRLQCTAYYQDWSTVGLLHVTGSAIVPSSIFEVENVSSVCTGTENTCMAVSAPLTLNTTRWADVEIPYNPPSTSDQPDSADISVLVNKFRSAAGAPIKARALLAGSNAFGEIPAAIIQVDFGFNHVSACVDAFRGLPYPHTIATCP